MPETPACATVETGGGQPLDDGERAGLAQLHRQIDSSPWASAPDLGDAVELVAMLLRLDKKAEKERW